VETCLLFIKCFMNIMSRCVSFENCLILLGKIGHNLGEEVFTLLQKLASHYELSGKKEIRSFSDTVSSVLSSACRHITEEWLFRKESPSGWV